MRLATSRSLARTKPVFAGASLWTLVELEQRPCGGERHLWYFVFECVVRSFGQPRIANLTDAHQRRLPNQVVFIGSERFEKVGGRIALRRQAECNRNLAPHVGVGIGGPLLQNRSSAPYGR